MEMVNRSIKALINARGLKPRKLTPEQVKEILSSSRITPTIYAGLITSGRDSSKLRKKTVKEVINDVPNRLLDVILTDLFNRYVEAYGIDSLTHIIRSNGKK
jgi:hypothetical protein